MQCITIPPEVIQDIKNKGLSRKKISWSYIERICYSFDDILLITETSIQVGLEIVGIPTEKIEKFLCSKGIKL